MRAGQRVRLARRSATLAVDADAPPLLRVDRIHTFYGDAEILRGLSLQIGAGETVCLLGRNGRGKTTAIKSILGLAPVRAGHIAFDGADITRMATHLIARRGIAWVPDNRRVFPTLTVERNLQMALNRSLGEAAAAAPTERWTLDRVYERFPILGRLRQRTGEHLSGGEAQLVAIARALLMHPKLVLLDEPSQGLAPRVVEDIMAVIEEIRDEGIAMLLVEQNSSLALGIARRAYVIDDGRIVHASTAVELQGDDALRQRLLAV
jgi:branched-chain amino acid transport system ATP-binding protein